MAILCNFVFGTVRKNGNNNHVGCKEVPWLPFYDCCIFVLDNNDFPANSQLYKTTIMDSFYQHTLQIHFKNPYIKLTNKSIILFQSS